MATSTSNSEQAMKSSQIPARIVYVALYAELLIMVLLQVIASV